MSKVLILVLGAALLSLTWGCSHDSSPSPVAVGSDEEIVRPEILAGVQSFTVVPQYDDGWHPAEWAAEPTGGGSHAARVDETGSLDSQWVYTTVNDAADQYLLSDINPTGNGEVTSITVEVRGQVAFSEAGNIYLGLDLLPGGQGYPGSILYTNWGTSLGAGGSGSFNWEHTFSGLHLSASDFNDLAVKITKFTVASPMSSMMRVDAINLFVTWSPTGTSKEPRPHSE